ncbi:MAG TPA: DUF885 family protein [Caulobacteraceae bacterium]|nr:DUF885 family protein [Caulobacteraceae bacterium]
MNRLDRRQLLLTAGSAAALVAPVAALAQAPSGPEGAKLEALLDAFFHEQLLRSPEQASNLGLDTGDLAVLRSKLKDRSAKGLAGDRAAMRDRMARLKSIDRSKLNGPETIDYDTLVFVTDSSLKVHELDIGGEGFSPSPYVLSPITGAYQSVPDFLNTKHRVENASDAQAYLDRLHAFATVLDDDTARLRHDVAEGVIPPDFLIDTTITQLNQLAVPADRSGLVESLARRAKDKGLGDGWRDKASAVYAASVLPALQRQIAAVQALRPRATHDAGVWRFKKGPDFYRANLRYTTTTNMTPEEVHKMGLDQAAEISARLDGLLKQQGLTQGTVGERIQSLYKDPSQYYPNTDAGREQTLDYLRGRLEAVKKRLPTMFDRIPDQQIEVRRVPPAIDAGAPGAYSEAPSLDHKRPGMIFFNLHDTREHPKWDLATTLYHEGLPGHQLQGGIAQQFATIPTIRRTMYFSGYGEGWALYAEQLADELGMYEDDPLGRIGYLKAQIFRCGRCVVDTGIHTMRWSREQAVKYLMELDGDAVGSTTREVDRYCAIPAQACSYKIGHTVWNRLRNRSRAQLGPRFDIRAFHDAGLVPGAMPLDVLDRAIADWARTVEA